ncbi:uncharacterized protein LOC115624157 [Scaptodrosophila lebanonensis]|uniref:Uncharacterized protein LOC115624157 n=1 Tax=Drosophila lebanonensis TaxID=7225 RepID=A0A6J2THM2_DROLE|nr:uncharacterized protein LOC115624157 [Scaptodrosophila lebanonensis]
MVGPFMQGFLLIGIIYWYSKGMMSMINDYYRSEFQRKIQVETTEKTTEKAPLNVDNFMDYVRELDEGVVGQSVKSIEECSIKRDSVCKSPSLQLWTFLHITGAWPARNVCRIDSYPVEGALI